MKTHKPPLQEADVGIDNMLDGSNKDIIARG